MTGCWHRRAVRIDVSDQVGQRGELETFDERAALSNGFRELQRADRPMMTRNVPNDADRIIDATVEHDNQLELAGVILFEVSGVIPEHRFNPALLVIGGNQQEDAGCSL